MRQCDECERDFCVDNCPAMEAEIMRADDLLDQQKDEALLKSLEE